MRARLTALLAVSLVVGLVAAPAGAKQVEPVGELIKLFYDQDGETPGNQWTITAGTPFHIQHGHAMAGYSQNAYLLPVTVDGVLITPDVVEVQPANKELWGFTYDSKNLQRLFNFHDGLEVGTYVITGTWFVPCGAAVRLGFIEGPCVEPNEAQEIASFTLELTVEAPGGP